LTGTAKHELVDVLWGQSRSAQDFLDALGAERAWGQASERAAELPDGSAHRPDDHDVTHLRA
jgi:hypothetical protein